MPPYPLKMMVHAALLASLMAVGAYLVIPVGPAPITLQTLFILLAGLLLGPKWGAASVAVYLLAGSAGLPVFSGGRGGLGVIFGPTGGYLLGFLPATYIIGWLSEKIGRGVEGDILAAICGSLLVYLTGVSWLMVLTKMSFSKAVAVGVLPFLLGDALKIAAAALLVKTIRPLIQGRQS